MERNKVLTIIFIIICLILIPNITNATFFDYSNRKNLGNLNLGDKILISIATNKNQGALEMNNVLHNTYCVQAGQQFEGLTAVRATRKIHIDGKNSTLTVWGKSGESKKTSIENLKMSYILNLQDEGSIHQNHKYSNKQKAIYQFFPTWAQKVIGIDDVTFSGGDYTCQTIINDAENYANNYKEGNPASISGTNGNQSNVKIENIIYNNVSYIKIGPINWKYEGNYSKIVIKDQNQNQVDDAYIKYGKYEGNNLKLYEKISEASISGNNFYILINSNININKVSEIKATVSKTITKYTNDIWILTDAKKYKEVNGKFIIDSDSFWDSYNSNAQKLIYVTKNEIETTSTATITIKDILLQGDLKVIKYDEDSKGKLRLPGVGFNIQHKETGKYIKQNDKGVISYVDKANATTFITDKNGEILVENLIYGTYIAYETQNPHYGYEIIKDGKEVELVVGEISELPIGNKQKYIKLSGYVWEDFIQDDKVSTKNNLFHDGTSDVNDKLLNGITVRLKDSSGKVIQETKTQKLDIYTTNGNDGNGEYRFENVEKDKLGDYYIEFEYDGLVYTNVSPNINLNNGSKSIESTTERESFNKGFSTVRGEKNQSSSIGVGYTTDSPDSDKGNKVYDLTYKLSNHTATLENDGKTFIIVANTTDAGYNLDSQHIAGQEEIQYINLGIYKRSQPQLVVRKEIENVKLGINDFEHTYVYENRFDNQEIKTEFQQSGYGVKFGEKYLNTKYSLPVYNSDYITELADTTKELKVYITYKIEIVNQSGDLYSQVNSIVDYYDDQCTIVKAGTTLDNTGNIGNVLQTKNVTDKNFNGYNSTRILTQSKIEPNKSQEIYVQFELSREKVKDIIEYNESNISQKELVDNVAEIYEYSTYDENGKIYAGIDKSSNPANAEPGNTDTFELDTDRAPGLLLEDGGDRQVTGIVFEDKHGTADDLSTGQKRQGNGKWDKEEGEPVIEEKVTVTLKDKNGTEKGSTTTNENGEYAISGFIPGEYNIVFSWGNGDKYIVEDYKGTVYDKTRYDTNSSNLYWYKEDSEKQTRYSDALDDYTIRERIPTDWIEPSGTIMNSKTPNFKVDVEIESDPNTGKKISSQISNIDFGIIEMARQAIEIHKNVSELKITLANGQTIVDAKMEDGKLLEPVPWVKFEGKKLWVEMESELIQGSQLNLKYDMSIDNKSEIDYITDDYYLYGIEPEAQEEKDEKVAKIELDVVYDYIDSEFMLNNEENGDWTEISENEYNTVENTTNTILTIQELWNREYIITDGKPEKNDSVDYSQLSDWEDEAKISRNEYFKDKAILATDSFDGKLKPGKSTRVVNLTASKILGGNDEVDLNNEVEITKIVKDSTRKITPFESVVKAKAESTTVTSPTGENRNYIIPVIISISVLIVLGAGIILIKKKIIEK